MTKLQQPRLGVRCLHQNLSPKKTLAKAIASQQHCYFAYVRQKNYFSAAVARGCWQGAASLQNNSFTRMCYSGLGEGNTLASRRKTNIQQPHEEVAVGVLNAAVGYITIALAIALGWLTGAPIGAFLTQMHLQTSAQPSSKFAAHVWYCLLYFLIELPLAQATGLINLALQAGLFLIGASLGCFLGLYYALRPPIFPDHCWLYQQEDLQFLKQVFCAPNGNIAVRKSSEEGQEKCEFNSPDNKIVFTLYLSNQRGKSLPDAQATLNVYAQALQPLRLSLPTYFPRARRKIALIPITIGQQQQWVFAEKLE